MSLRAAQGFATRQRSTLPTIKRTHIFRPSSAITRSFISTPSLVEYVHDHYPDTSAPTTSTSSFDRRERLIAIKTRMLLDAVAQKSPNIGAVWTYYLDLMDLSGTLIPAEIHQLVLRNAIPPPRRARSSAKAQYRSINYHFQLHPYEDRMMAVVRNMRAAAIIPTLEDYHWILTQLASVGHFTAAEKILKELHILSIEPVPATYGYVLQACAHRVTLPAKSSIRAEERREQLLREVHATCSRILAEMTERHVPVTTANADLALRLLREKATPEEFNNIVMRLYGIDLSFLDSASGDDILQSRDNFTPASPTLSSQGLNIILDSLGMQGRISTMVAAFEVLTNPLPSISPSPGSFDDDDDDGPYSATRSTRRVYATPNSTTFNTLIRHVALSNNPTLARHYALLAYETDRDRSRTFRQQLKSTDSADQLIVQRMMVQKSMLWPILHLANRDLESPLLQWVHLIARRSASWKRTELEAVERWRTRQAQGRQVLEVRSDAPADTQSGAERSTIAGPQQADSPSTSDSLSSSLPVSTASSPHLTTSSTLRDGNLPQASRDAQPESAQPDDILPWLSPITTFLSPSPSLNVVEERSEPDVSSPSDTTPFDPTLHMFLLARERDRLIGLMNRIEGMYSRTQQRIKEKLGRRVWVEKDIYLRTEDDRLVVDRGRWRKTVNFWSPEDLQNRRRRFWGPPMPFTSALYQEERPPREPWVQDDK